MTLTFNEQWLEEEHICFYVEEKTGSNLKKPTLVLYEIVKRTYKHPEMPNEAFVYQLEQVNRGEFVGKNHPELLMLLYSMGTVQKIEFLHF